MSVLDNLSPVLSTMAVLYIVLHVKRDECSYSCYFETPRHSVQIVPAPTAASSSLPPRGSLPRPLHQPHSGSINSSGGSGQLLVGRNSSDRRSSMSRLAQSSQRPTGGHSGEGLNVDVEGGNNHSDDAASESPSLPDQNPYHYNVDTGVIKRSPPHTKIFTN